MSKKTIEMDQETAKKLFEEGGFLIFLGVPEGTEFGIDMKSWNTGDKFRGVKMIPPGLHFIFYSSVSKTGDVSPRIGFFHSFRGTEILVKKWDKQTEGISGEPVPESEIVGLKQNITALDEFLGPYPYDIYEKWISLTSNITENLLKKLVPDSGEIRSALELQSCTDSDRPRGNKSKILPAEACCSTSKKSRLSEADENNLLPILKPLEGTALKLTEFPEKNYPNDSTPSEITQHSLDSTYVLNIMIAKYSRPEDLIGEMEFCFVCFLVGHSLEAFEQWKKLVTLLCSCDIGIEKYKQLYSLFITVLETHIKEIPEEFLADIVTNNNFVYSNLKKLFRTIKDSNVNDVLKTKVQRFQNHLTLTYLWDFDQVDSEDEDEAPVIVET